MKNDYVLSHFLKFLLSLVLFCLFLCFIVRVQGSKCKNIYKQGKVMFNSLKIWKTTKYLSKTTDFNRNSVVCKKKIISYHSLDLLTVQNNNTTLELSEHKEHSWSKKLKEMIKRKRAMKKQTRVTGRK